MILLRVLSLCLLAFFSLNVFAANITWVGTSSQWSVASNWDLGIIPTATDHVIINSSGTANPILDMDRSVAGVTYSSKTLDLGGFTLAVTGTSSFASGNITNGHLDITCTGDATFSGTSFGVSLSVQVANLYLNGSIFNDSCYFEKTGSTHNYGQGGNTFNGFVEIQNVGSGVLFTGCSSRDIYYQDVIFTNAGAGSIQIANNSATNLFNGNIYVNSTKGNGIYFGHGGNARVELAVGKKIIEGSLGFKSGFLSLGHFFFLETVPFNLTLTGGAVFAVTGGTTFNETVRVTAPGIRLDGGIFNDSTYFEKTGSTHDYGQGGNRFNGFLEIQNLGSGGVFTGCSSPDIFYQDVIFTNAGAGSLQIANNSATNLFNGNIYVNSTKGNGIYFGQGGKSRVELAVGKKIVEGSLGFKSGFLSLGHFFFLETVPFNLTLTGGAIFAVTGGTTFNETVRVTAPGIRLDGGIFNDSTYFEKTGSYHDYGQGGNTFNGFVEIKNVGSGVLHTGGSSRDIYYQDVIFTNAGAGSLQIANNSATNLFNGNIYVNSTKGGGIYFGHGGRARVELAVGKKIVEGSLGFKSGFLSLGHFFFLETVPFNLTLTGGAIFAVTGGTTFNETVRVTAPGVRLDGGIFNDSTYFEKTGSYHDYGQGGNRFNGFLEIQNVGSGGVFTGCSSPDIFYQDVIFTNSGAGSIQIANNSSTNLFNGNIYVNSTKGGGVDFGHGNRSRVELAAGKKIIVGNSGFTHGTLSLGHFFFKDTVPFNLTMFGSAIFKVAGGTTFNAPVRVSSPGIILSGGVFNDSTYFNKTGGTYEIGIGGNVFKGFLEIINSGSNNLCIGDQLRDIFYQDAVFTNSGTGAIFIANVAANNLFNGNIYVNSISGKGIRFCYNNTASAVLAPGKTITVGDLGFKAGHLIFGKFIQEGVTPQNLNLSGGAWLQFSHGTVFNASLTVACPGFHSSKATFNESVDITRTGGGNSLCGGNTFNSDVVIKNTGVGNIFYHQSASDISHFYGSLTLEKLSAGEIRFTNAGVSNLYGDFTFNSSEGIPDLVANGGNCVFTGGEDQIIDGSQHYVRFNKITINKNAGNLILDTNLVLVYTSTSLLPVLDLTKGKIITGANFIHLSNDGIIANASAQNFIDGTLRKGGDDAFIFPIGKGNIYRPVAMTAPSGTSDVFLAEYVSAPAPDAKNISGDVKEVSVCEYWNVQRLAGTSSPALSFSWTSACSYIDPAVTFLAGKDPVTGSWGKVGNFINGTADSGSVSSSALSSYGLFTFGYNIQVVTPARNAFANLQKDLDGGVYYSVNNKLYFRYKENYMDGPLNYKILDYSRTSILPQAEANLVKTIGINDFALDLSVFNLVPGAFYTLEVRDEKKGIYKLKFQYKG